MEQPEIELTHTDPEFLPVQYDMQIARIRKLKKEYDPKLIPEANTKGDDGYLVVHEKAMAIVKVRTNIERIRKDLNADAITWTKKVNTEAKRLTTIVEEFEAPWAKVKADLDAKEAREAEAARQKEQKRIEAIEERIANIKKLAEGLLGASADVIKSRLDLAIAIELDEDRFDDYLEAAEHTKSTVVLALTAAYEVQINFEQQQEDLRKQQEELTESQRQVDEQLKQSEPEPEVKPEPVTESPVQQSSPPQTDKQPLTGFDGWWDSTGQNIKANGFENQEAHVLRVARAAWVEAVGHPF